MNRVACVMSVLAMLAFAGPRAYACACADFPASEIASWSRAEFSRRFTSGRAAIFLGRVVEGGEPYPTEHGPSRVYTFEVQRYWKGAAAKRVYIHTAVFGAACGVTYEVNKTYLVIAQWDGGELFTGLCTHRLANRNREIFLRKLGGGKVQSYEGQRGYARTKPNNGMHPTRFSVPLMQDSSLEMLCAGG